MNSDKQNELLENYIYPIVNLEFGKVIENYKKNKRKQLRKEMEEVGVFDSLEKLEREGTSWEKIQNDLRYNIRRPKKEYYHLISAEELEKIIKKSMFSNFDNNNHRLLMPSPRFLYMKSSLLNKSKFMNFKKK